MVIDDALQAKDKIHAQTERPDTHRESRRIADFS